MKNRPANETYRPVVAGLAQSEERFRLLVESVRRYAIFMLDSQGTIVTWNRGMHELLGYERNDIIGQSGGMIFSAADRAAGLPQRELVRAKRSGESVLEHWDVHKDGRQISVQDTCTALFGANGKLLGFAKVTRRLEGPADAAAEAAALELAKALAALQVEIDHRRQLEVQLLTAVEAERERLGRDLHDDLSQHLSAIAMMLGSFAKQVRRRSASDAAEVTKIANSLTEAVVLARNLARGLHPVTLTSQGLPAALAELAERVPLEVDFKWPDSARLDFDPSVALHVYRIAEEAVGNAIRHAGAKKIAITVDMKPDRYVMLTIADDGKGFAPARFSHGMGLQNMQYRARAVEGTLEIVSAPDRGTRVTCTVPLRTLLPKRARRPRSKKAAKPARRRAAKRRRA